MDSVLLWQRVSFCRLPRFFSSSRAISTRDERLEDNSICENDSVKETEHEKVAPWRRGYVRAPCGKTHAGDAQGLSISVGCFVHFGVFGSGLCGGRNSTLPGLSEIPNDLWSLDDIG